MLFLLILQRLSCVPKEVLTLPPTLPSVWARSVIRNLLKRYQNSLPPLAMGQLFSREYCILPDVKQNRRVRLGVKLSRELYIGKLKELIHDSQ